MEQALYTRPILALPQIALEHHLQDAPEHPAHAQLKRRPVGVQDLFLRRPLPSRSSDRRPPAKNYPQRQALVLLASAHRPYLPTAVRDTSRPAPYAVPSDSPSVVFRSRFKIQPTADVLAEVFQTASHKERKR